MTVNSIGSTQSLYPTSASTENKRRQDDFAALFQAMQSGDTSAAQAALQTFQKDIQSTTGTQNAVSSNSQLSKDMDALQSALKSGDTAGAKKAFDAMKQDLKGMKVHGHHHHHHSEGSTATQEVTPTTSTNTDQQSVASSLNKLV